MKGKRTERDEREEHPAQRITRILHAAVRCRYGKEARNEDIASSPEMGDFASSYGRFPGHEANYPALGRLLWEMGRQKKSSRKT